MRHCALWGCSLKDAYLRGVDLSHSSLKMTNLRGADLRGSRLVGCEFASADLTNAKLGGVTWTPYKLPPKRAALRTKGAWRARAVASGVSSALLSSQEDDEDDDGNGDGDDDGEGEGDDDASPKAQWQRAASSVLNRALGSVVAGARRVVLSAEELRTELRAALLGDAMLGQMIRTVDATLNPLLRNAHAAEALAKEASARRQPSREALVCALKPALDDAVGRLLAQCFSSLLPRLVVEAEARVLRAACDENESEGEEADGVQKELQAGERDEAAANAIAKLVFEQLRSDSLLCSLRVAVEEKLLPMKPLAAELLAARALACLHPTTRPPLGASKARSPAAAETPSSLDAAERALSAQPALPGEAPDVDGFVENGFVENGFVNNGFVEDGFVEAQLRLLCTNALGSLEEQLDASVRSLLHARVRAAAAGAEQAGRPIGRLVSSFEAYEARLASLLESDGGAAAQLVRRYAPKGQLESMVFHGVLHAVTKYQLRDGATIGALRLACARSRAELVRDENELAYLLEKLQQVENKETTEMSWRDTFESWQGLLKLRSQLLVERGQAVLDCIVADPKVRSPAARRSTAQCTANQVRPSRRAAKRML